jgi:serpin B
MIIVLPDQIDALREVGSRLNGRALAQLFARLQRPPHHVNLGLPRFKTGFEVALKDYFHALGMAQAFDEAKADFSGMTGGSRGIYIGEIQHRAVIEVGEDGTEATAATAADMVTSAPPSFQVNRPFLFYIVEATTNAILFQGRIADPR